MPRPKKAGEDAREVKKRSRNGCWPCKARKVKCGEEKPACTNCQRQGETCDYSIRLNWDGRNKKKDEGTPGSNFISFDGSNAGSPQETRTLAPRNGNYPATTPSPHIPFAHEMATDNIYHSLHPDQTSLPSITDFTNDLPLPAADFNPAMLQPPPLLRTPTWSETTNGTSHFAPIIPQLRQTMSLPPYPSPDSNLGSPGLNGHYNMGGYSAQMPPPMPTSNPMLSEAARSPYNGAKRIKMSPRTESYGRDPTLLGRGQYGGIGMDEGPRVQFNTSVFYSPFNPMTPAASSTSHQDAEDRRISVSSLLSEDPKPEERKPSLQNTTYTGVIPASELPIERRGSLHQRMISYLDTETYGQDRGYPDLDIPRNNDTLAITGASPSEHSDFDSWLNDTDIGVAEFGFRLENRDTVFQKGGYYASPVPIKIPKKFEPLPQILSENPMNLLYFHHFLNHTARILVPHDCPENPFKTILPKMALENPNLLNLLLAYSACHRARLLNHPEPRSRIAIWTRDVFPSLRQTLDNVMNTEVSNANLATAIMLASLEIISPSSFGVSIPWQNHLSIARSIIRSRGGPHSISRKDPVMYFLSTWLAYLDVLGSLSGRKNEEPLFEGNYWSSSHDDNSSSTKELSLSCDCDDEDDYTIDCLLGFTTRCVAILAQIALLARQCDQARLLPNGEINTLWRPPPHIHKRAGKLRRDLEHARDHEQKACSHHSPETGRSLTVGEHRRMSYVERRLSFATSPDQEALEALAYNKAFHTAGLIHLLRRVENLPRSDPAIQQAVHEIVEIIQTLREGGSAEACLLFPMFTAGVEAVDPMDRAEILARVKGSEGLGMCQVSRARRIIEEVWRTGRGWEGLVSGEFFG